MLRIALPDCTIYIYGQVFSHTDGKGQIIRLMRTARRLPGSREKATRLTALVNENNATYSLAYDISAAEPRGAAG